MNAYVIGEIEVTDPAVYDDYRKQVLATITKYGGRFLARGGKAEALEDAAPKRMVILEFPSYEQALKWYRSPEMFAVGYDITDLQPYFIPNHLLGALFLGVGLHALLRRLEGGQPARALAVTALVAPILLGVIRAPRVIAQSGRDAATHARNILADLGPGSIVIAEYQDFQFMLYYKLMNSRASAGPYIAHESVGLGEVLAYLRDGKELKLRHLGLSLPPGLDLYSQKLFAPKHYEQAGLTVEPWRHELYRITYTKP